MPITKSAKKALRVSRRKAEINLKWKRGIKDLLKKSRKAIEKKDKEAPKLVAQTAKTLDKAAKKHIIHKNKASRLKSRLMLKLSKAFGKGAKLPKVTEKVVHTPKPKTKKSVEKKTPATKPKSEEKSEKPEEKKPQEIKNIEESKKSA